MRPVELLLSRLDGVQPAGQDRWMARCPVHDDRKQSLSVAEGKEGALLKCHANCPTEEIVSELGLTMSDLFLDHTLGMTQKQIVATYDYENEKGELLFQVVRFDPKDFRQRRKEWEEWDWNINGVERVPYQLPRLLKAVAEDKPIAIVEGEKDVHAVEQAGYTATCNPGGAGKWKPSYSKYLEGARVGVIADRDDPGRKHAFEVAKSLQGIAKSVKVLEPPEKKDMAAHLLSGGLFAELIPAKCPCCGVRCA